MTEFSTSFDIDNKKVSAPLLVPTLSEKEVSSLTNGKSIPESVYEKAHEHATKRIENGKDPFAQPNELRADINAAIEYLKSRR